MENWITKLYDKKDVTDPFVDVRLGKARVAKTAILDNTLNPQWKETFRIEVSSPPPPPSSVSLACLVLPVVKLKLLCSFLRRRQKG